MQSSYFDSSAYLLQHTLLFEIGEALGVAALSERFIHAPIELEYFEDECVRVSISESVSVRTKLSERHPGARDHEWASKDRRTGKSVWVPGSLHVKDPERAALSTILSHLDATRGERLSESGIFEIGERFVSAEAPELSASDVITVANSLPFKVSIEVHRSVSLGYSGEPLVGDEDGDPFETPWPYTEDDGWVAPWEPEEQSDVRAEEE